MSRRTAADLGRAIVESAKHKRDYGEAERLFDELFLSMQELKHPSPLHITSFQRSIGTMVRHAPTPQKALDYTCFLLRNVDEPLRNEELENLLLVNCIYVYSRAGTKEYFSNGLELIKVGLERGVALPKSQNTIIDNREPQNMVFRSVALQILRHFGLQIADDLQHLEPFQRNRARRI